MTTEQEIEKANADLDAAREAVIAAQNRLQDLQTKLAFEKHGVSIGSRVKHSRKGSGIVTRIDGSFGQQTKPWVYARRLKKDGTQGLQVVCFYGEWTLDEKR